MTLDELSLVALYSAMAVYALAFIAFAIDLSRRGTAVQRAEIAARKQAKQAQAAGGVLVETKTDVPTEPVEYRDSPSLRVGVALTVIGWALQLGATVLRGFAASRVPWANMYEFALTGTLLIVTVFLLTIFISKQDLRFLGTFIIGLVLLFLGVATVNFYVAVAPLPPALQSAWLVIHVFVATAATGFFALGAALSVLQLMQTRRERKLADGQSSMRFLGTLPNAEKLETLAYRINIIGFILWTFTLMAGAIWAERAWGRYWGWDTKEVWTFIIWVLYAGYIHARATRGWRGSRASWLAIVGFTAILFNFTIVNLFFKGLHAYSGLQ